MTQHPDWQQEDFVQGYWRLADWRLTPKQLVGFIESHLELGIRWVDHADIYGDYRCEALFGQALKLAPALRDQLKIVTKCGIALLSEQFPQRVVKHYNSQAGYIRQAVDNSLTQLQTQHLDLVLLHRPDLLMQADEVASEMEDLMRQGKVGQFGVSNFTPRQFDLLQSRLSVPLATNQVEINPLSLGVFEDGTLEHLQQHRVRPMAWSPLAGGRLLTDAGEQAQRVRSVLTNLGAETGGYSLSQMALAWLRRLPSNPLIVLGTGNRERLAESVAASQIDLSAEQWYRVWVAATGVEVP